ncbi:pseudoazurin [Marinobacter sp. CHS3-4]|uniref:pseudoazurin n=1 Tax=Marinobacter sp. CHS3-4 TaxID=3045174 RepID=UPI0024B5F56D|nr:pseudoazurin [Marinobacter sp. CHS3-4]MDI9244356.1 pseudoazurin [Marinobacter sp. CHS3-4]
MRKLSVGLLAAMVSTGALAAEHIVKMKNAGAEGPMVFEPGYLEAKKGDTVKFVMTDPAHNSVSVAVPEGAESWSGQINQEITVTLDAEGVYVYKCTPHAPLNMAGVIKVGEPTNYDDAKAAVEKLTAAAATNKDRLKNYFANVK